ncbi:MAG: Glu/Leu/Phe/Val dehydrogenase dimerization domain-containing protein [Planctomycetota bacterium]
METLALMSDMGHENVFYCHDASTGLKAIIGIHDTTLGPALGGCRMLPYATEQEALIDVLRLSKGMTYKSSVAGIDLGGGKSVIIGDPVKNKSPDLMRRFGDFVQRLNGKYITAEDMGTTVEDMNTIFERTKYVTGKSKEMGGSGNPSPLTAMGTFWGLKAACKEAFGTDSVKGRRIAIQGVGSVGLKLAEMLHAEGAELTVTDTNAQAIETAKSKFGAKSVPLDKIYEVDMDVFSPCARGAILNDATIKVLKARVVAGAANNQLQDPDKHGKALKERGIVYAPDYVINAGGVINVFFELIGYDEEKSKERAKNIYNTIDKIIAMAKKQNISTHDAAQKVAEERIQAAKRQNAAKA